MINRLLDISTDKTAAISASRPFTNGLPSTQHTDPQDVLPQTPHPRKTRYLKSMQYLCAFLLASFALVLLTQKAGLANISNSAAQTTNFAQEQISEQKHPSAKPVYLQSEKLSPYAKPTVLAQRKTTTSNKGTIKRNEFSPKEAAHRSKMDKAISPLVNLPLSNADAKNLLTAIRALRKKNSADALVAQSVIANPVAKKLITWYRLRTGQGSIPDYSKFIDANPNWPNIWLLTKNMERQLFKANNPALTRKYIGKSPQTPAGFAALAAAHLALGDKSSAKKVAANTWRNMDIPSDLEGPFLKRLGSLLTPQDHKWRLDRLMIADIRWTKSRNARAKRIRRQISRLSKAERRKANARLAVFSRKKNARALMAKLPPSKQTDWGVVFQRIELLRRSGKITESSKLMLGAVTEKAKIVNPDAWWGERRRLAYEALQAKNPKLAYALVRDAGDLSVNPLKKQHFLAGWIALRYLHDTKAAIHHFKTMSDHADGPLSISKSAYWLGRAYETAGDGLTATHYYKQATARQIDTFHALLSRLKISPKDRTIPIVTPALPTTAQIQSFNNSDVAKAAVIAKRAKLGRTIMRQFTVRLSQTKSTEAEVAMAAHLSQALGDIQQSLRIGKKAIARGMNLIIYAYPLHAFPEYKPLRKPPETAFLLAIARQESEFNTDTLSGAGARGILQVMPITAKHVCRDYKIKCHIKRLMTDEAYNIKIASAYIADRMGEFGGSYVMGLSGYNAGPGRTRQWVRQFGDPRDGKIDPIDWIERLPFNETRSYVAKVLSNIQIYRARLGQGSNALRLDKDLIRAQKPVPSNRKLKAPGT